MKLLGLPMDSNVNDTPHVKLTHAAFGAAYGLLGGTAFVITAAFVDILPNPDLPLAMDFDLLTVRWLLIAFGLALVGAMTSWWSETWSGLGSGAMTARLPGIGKRLVCVKRKYKHEIGRVGLRACPDCNCMFANCMDFALAGGKTLA